MAQVSAVSRLFREVSMEMLSWQGSSVCIGPKDLELSHASHRFEILVPKWSGCSHTFLNFEGAHVGAKRAAAQQCLQMISSRCVEVSCLVVRNWFMLEQMGLRVLHVGFPQLRHLELNGCDQISSYSAMVPVFKEHPKLLSLRATFQPRAVAGVDFASAAPRTLVALGFVNFDSAETLAIMLERCMLEHLWFSATCTLPSGVLRGTGLDRTDALLRNGLGRLRTLSLPATMPEDECAALLDAVCPKVEMLCRMRIGSPAFGTGALAANFELVPGGGGVVVRRCGTCAGLAVNGALWAPYAQDDSDMMTRKPSAVPARKVWDVTQSCARSLRAHQTPGAGFNEELAVAAAARRR